MAACAPSPIFPQMTRSTPRDSTARDLLVVGIVKRDGLFFDGLDILNGINGKLRGMAEMLHHFAILAG